MNVQVSKYLPPRCRERLLHTHLRAVTVTVANTVTYFTYRLFLIVVTVTESICSMLRAHGLFCRKQLLVQSLGNKKRVHLQVMPSAAASSFVFVKKTKVSDRCNRLVSNRNGLENYVHTYKIWLLYLQRLQLCHR